MMAWPPKRAWRAGAAGERGAGWRSVQTYGEFIRAPGGFMRWACSHFKVCISIIKSCTVGVKFTGDRSARDVSLNLL